MKKIELAKIYTELWEVMERFNSPNIEERKVIEHAYQFSNMFGISDEDIQKGAYRFLPKNPYEIIKVNYNKVPTICMYDKEQNEYLPVGTYEELKDNKEFLRRIKNNLAFGKDIGYKADTLENNDKFYNQYKIDLLLKQGDTEILCRPILFCQPLGKFCAPVRADNENGFVFVDVAYENSFYRTTKYPSMATYVAIPKTAPILFVNTYEDSANDMLGQVKFFKPNMTQEEFNDDWENHKKYKDMEELMNDKEVVEMCRENALDELPIIDVKAPDTKVYMIVND